MGAQKDRCKHHPGVLGCFSMCSSALGLTGLASIAKLLGGLGAHHAGVGFDRCSSRIVYEQSYCGARVFAFCFLTDCGLALAD